MKYAKRLRAAAMMLLFVPLAGCALTAIQSNASRCSDLLPDSWTAGVDAVTLPESRALPDGHDDAQPWQEAFVGQTGRLEMANGRFTDSLGIIRRCEDRDAAAIRKAKRRLF